MRFILYNKLRKNLIIIKYLLASVSVYIYIIVSLYVLADLFNVNKIIAYVLVYVTAYIFEYTSTLYFVFNEEHKWIKVIKYITYVAVFLGFSTYLFKVLLSFNIHYIVATLLVAAVLMPVRFVVNKYWVYR